jgi:uroporphyrinogen-III synthase
MTARDRPLVGRHVLLTRPAGRGAGLAGRLEQLGARVTRRPTIALEPPRDPGPARRAVARLDVYDHVVFTSPNGVRFFLARIEEVRGQEASIEPCVAAIGPATARELEIGGRKADLVAPDPRSEGLARALERSVAPGERVLLVSPERSRPVVPDALRALGASVERVVFYRNVPAPGLAALGEEIRGNRFDVVVFSSPSTLQRLLEAGESDADALLSALGRSRPVAIGPVTARALRDAGLVPAAVADEPSDDGVARAVRALFP